MEMRDEKDDGPVGGHGSARVFRDAHGILRGDGDLSGCRWGVAHKRQLLAREAVA